MAGSSQPKTPSFKKTASTGSTGKSQKSILGFFQKKTVGALQPQINGVSSSGRSIELPIGSPKKKKQQLVSQGPSFSQSLTPAPSSDAIDVGEEEDEDDVQPAPKRRAGNGLPSPLTPAERGVTCMSSSPIRKGKKTINYAESGDDLDDSEEDVFKPETKPRRRLTKRQRTSDASEDNYSEDIAAPADDDDDEFDDLDEDDFIVPDDSENEASARKRKRPQTKSKQVRSSPSTGPGPRPPSSDVDDDLEMPTVSTAQQWVYDAENIDPTQKVKPAKTPVKKDGKPVKQKAHTTEPEQRRPWLANMLDADKHPVGHPDYDPRTLYIPPHAFKDLSEFEKQFWTIKQTLMDTIVFFKKGKFYELYESDATIGHQLFDLKLTDRVNMRMVGVPESSLDHWANQFVAKGYKIARVDQKETALGKEMRERGGKKASNAPKVIHRELACVLTAGTLVDGGMLQDDMSTFCVSIKESVVDGLPAFGIAFVDAATGSFLLTEFVDDVDLTKFETFVAQTRPQELLLEKSKISTKALRILKNNTGPTTLWNYLKPDKEFWDAELTRRDIDASGYFATGEDRKAWPEVLEEARSKDLVMSALGGLIWYLRVLKIERDLLTLGNFTWYDPIRKASSLVLDGQTLINLEVFANTFDGSTNGTLFTLLNRCVTPFGKRTFKQWVCHPLMDAERINARLDAVDAFNADLTTRDQFTASLVRMPDLERLISRIHAGTCKAQDFVRVLDGYEQIQYTMGLLGAVGVGDGLIGQLVKSMPDLTDLLERWKTAFDHEKAKEHGLLVPAPGVEEDFDESQEHIEEILSDLDNLLRKARKDLGSSAIEFRDNGKEIYQLEVPVKVKNVPKNWDQMSATKQVKRYYSPELRALVRKLQEAQETHSQIVKEVAGRLLERFDEDYMTWLKAVKVVAQLDCLISLAKASSSLGEPCCRPVFVEDERSVMEFEDLRHPCMLPNVMDFIPNDIKLGGEEANITMLTGANAAGKSTILRMTCIAVIMAQIGCYVPCSYARMTPVDRIMSRLGANDNIFAAQSTFFVELSETKKILSEATPRSLVILDELGRGTSSYDGVAVAQAVLHHIATHIGCIGYFATHYHSLAEEFAAHPEVRNRRMRIHVDDKQRQITFLYKLEDGVAEGSFGMHCAAMCGIPDRVISRAEVAAREWEHTSRLKDSLETAKKGCFVPLGMQSDVALALKDEDGEFSSRALSVLREAISGL